MIHKLAFDSHGTFSKQAYLIVHIIALCAKILFNLITFQLIGFRIGKNIFFKKLKSLVTVSSKTTLFISICLLFIKTTFFKAYLEFLH